jgi:hypothetical protein
VGFQEVSVWVVGRAAPGESVWVSVKEQEVVGRRQAARVREGRQGVSVRLDGRAAPGKEGEGFQSRSRRLWKGSRRQAAGNQREKQKGFE